MLVLSRKLGETLVINGNITVKVIQVQGNAVRLGIEAPPEVPVHRAEIHDRLQRRGSFEIEARRPKPCVA